MAASEEEYGKQLVEYAFNQHPAIADYKRAKEDHRLAVEQSTRQFNEQQGIIAARYITIAAQKVTIQRQNERIVELEAQVKQFEAQQARQGGNLHLDWQHYEHTKKEVQRLRDLNKMLILDNATMQEERPKKKRGRKSAASAFAPVAPTLPSAASNLAPRPSANSAFNGSTASAFGSGTFENPVDLEGDQDGPQTKRSKPSTDISDGTFPNPAAFSQHAFNNANYPINGYNSTLNALSGYPEHGHQSVFAHQGQAPHHIQQPGVFVHPSSAPSSFQQYPNNLVDSGREIPSVQIATAAAAAATPAPPQEMAQVEVQAPPPSASQPMPPREIDWTSFMLRKDPGTLFTLPSVPATIRQHLEDCVSEWAATTRGGADWYDKLRKIGKGKKIRTCITARFRSSGDKQLWTVEHPTMFACRRCTNNRKVCCVWDSQAEKIVLLPLLPQLKIDESRRRDMTRAADETYWVRKEAYVTKTDAAARALFDDEK